MRFFTTGLILALATAEAVGSSNWFSKAVYNRWHETELERWLSDHDIPYPTPADRKDLENLIKNNWDKYVQIPISHTNEAVGDSYENAKGWIFDSWSESHLKTFLDKHGIPNPQPRKRDTLLATARESYESIAQKLGQTTLYPGNWLYEHWSESDLKEYLDSHGFNVPQPTSRDKLIAAVRRNSRRAGIEAQKAASVASSSAAAAQESLTEALFSAWSESDFKKFFDKHGIKVPQGSRRNELVALARKHRKSLLEEPTASVKSVYGAATTKAGNEYARATEDAQMKMDDLFNSAINMWSDSRLKAYLDTRGVPVPQGSKRDELLATVRLHRHKAAAGYSAWTFDTWNRENLGKYLSSQHKQALEKLGENRAELLKQAQDAYTSASKAGGSNYASVTSYLASATEAAKDHSFNSWSKEDLEKYLESYGMKGQHDASIDRLREEARRNADYFMYGTVKQEAGILDRAWGAGQWVWDQLKIGALSGRAEGQKAADAAKAKVSEAKEKSEL
ncbi:hypothetical protein LOZ61_005727 [Ophidiomyces ophidiicola]|nr:hypothetical protein LOZ61_005727 [Ophidiomyces ophidiicola]KAI1925949.1 hypothetical protein LOZ60_003838 [Ophidiomyces ophidiicola]KAI2139450.1 hypothetical protein LOZ27_005223 [Ophidiomyces ophidiicola]KAI2158518.1 hypothetical protein LOZ25_003344 [Ophidiomyces ophidiicola]KAI2411375.1 hypothetical protein LOY90_002198 [Ophidiomyces ophidiicola]